VRRKYTKLDVDEILKEFPNPFRTPVFEITEDGMFLVEVGRSRLEVESESIDPAERSRLRKVLQDELRQREREDASSQRRTA
jgi:hypothetical protein